MFEQQKISETADTNIQSVYRNVEIIISFFFKYRASKLNNNSSRPRQGYRLPIIHQGVDKITDFQ
jgi:hypothetical protein